MKNEDNACVLHHKPVRGQSVINARPHASFQRRQIREIATIIACFEVLSSEEKQNVRTELSGYQRILRISLDMPGYTIKKAD